MEKGRYKKKNVSLTWDRRDTEDPPLECFNIKPFC